MKLRSFWKHTRTHEPARLGEQTRQPRSGNRHGPWNVEGWRTSQRCPVAHQNSVPDSTELSHLLAAQTANCKLQFEGCRKRPSRPVMRKACFEHRPRQRPLVGNPAASAVGNGSHEGRLHGKVSLRQRFSVPHRGGAILTGTVNSPLGNLNFQIKY